MIEKLKYLSDNFEGKEKVEEVMSGVFNDKEVKEMMEAIKVNSSNHN